MDKFYEMETEELLELQKELVYKNIKDGLNYKEEQDLHAINYCINKQQQFVIMELLKEQVRTSKLFKVTEDFLEKEIALAEKRKREIIN